VQIELFSLGVVPIKATFLMTATIGKHYFINGLALKFMPQSKT